MSQPTPRDAGSRDERALRPPETLAVAGSGTVACGLAACAARAGVATVLWARSEASAGRARERIERERAKGGPADGDETAKPDGPPQGADLVEVTRDRDALGRATLLVESVIEDEFVKREVLRMLCEQAREGAVLASTTSSLNVAALASACPDPGRFFALHVFTPVTRMKLVELCFPTEAGEATRDRARAFCALLGKTAVEVPDEPGFVVNRLLFPYLFDAVRLLERTGLEPDAIDACMKLGAAHPMGPLELLDFIGLDVADAIGEAIFADTADPAHRPPGRIKRLVGEGHLGRKAGRGFRRY
jgi:3-hydroxyacyl-CoA dehydrogenase